MVCRVKNIVRILIVLSLSILTFSASSQVDPYACKDTTFASEFYPCPNEFNPVCGCDGVTYKNECYAKNKYGINTWENNICDAVDFDFYPNPMDAISSTLKLDIATREDARVLVNIYSFYGRLYYEKNINKVSGVGVYSEFINLSILPPGVYLIVVISNEEYKIKRLVKGHDN